MGSYVIFELGKCTESCLERVVVNDVLPLTLMCVEDDLRALAFVRR